MTRQQFQQHALSAAFPSMPGHEVDALAADIKANGQREPIVIFDGQVLDGWHRYRACYLADIEPITTPFPADGDPVAFVLSRNLHRRHLTESQRGSAAVACSKWMPAGKRAPGPLSKDAPAPPPQTNAQMAATADVSVRTIKRAKVAEGAGLGPAVRDGKVSAKRAAEIVKADPKVGKKIASGKTTPEEVIAKADKARPLPKTLPRPAPNPARPVAALATCPECERLRARAAELEAEAELHGDEVESLLKQIDGPDAMTKEIRTLKAQLRTVEQTRDAEMTKCAVAIDQVRKLERKLAKLERKVA